MTGLVAAVGERPGLWLAVLAFVLWLQPALGVLQLSPDAVEYVDIGRRLAAGEGYRLGVKAYHTGGSEVVHDGLDERAPLYPLLLAPLFRIGLGVAAVQVVNAALAAGCVALVYAIGSCLFDRLTGAVAGLLAALSPSMLINMPPPMSEAISILLALIGLWLLIRRRGGPTAAACALAGAVWGLDYLARPTALPMAGAVFVGVLVGAHGVRPWPNGGRSAEEIEASSGRAGARRAPLRLILAFVVGLVIFVVPMSAYSLATRGSLSYSGQAYHYSVFRAPDVMRDAKLRPLPSPLEFVQANREFVVSTIAANLRNYASMLFLDHKWLLPLALGWPAAVYALTRRRYRAMAWPVLLLAGANYLLYALTWATYQRRYALLTMLLLLPFAVDGLRRLSLVPFNPKLDPRGRLGTLVLAGSCLLAVVLWSPTFFELYRGTFRYGDEAVGTRTYRVTTWTGATEWLDDPDLQRMLDWAAASTQPGDVLAHGQPWLFTFFVNRPAVLLPRRFDADTLRSFLVDYRVAYLLLNTRDPDRRGYQDDLERLTGEGVRESAVNGYRVFDTSALWR